LFITSTIHTLPFSFLLKTGDCRLETSSCYYFGLQFRVLSSIVLQQPLFSISL
jgi:hypothetical protein